MPLYEYECQGCKERIEVIQKFADPPYEICPNCGGALRKLASSPAIQFKGSGFYATDYGKAGSKPSSSESPSSESKPSKSNSGE